MPSCDRSTINIEQQLNQVTSDSTIFHACYIDSTKTISIIKFGIPGIILMHDEIHFVSALCPFTNIHESQDCRGRRGHFFNSSLPLPLVLQTLRHYPGDYCKELTSAHSYRPDSNRESLVSECKSLTTKLRTPITTKLRKVGTRYIENTPNVVLLVH